jgi:hypothetical protein
VSLLAEVAASSTQGALAPLLASSLAVRVRAAVTPEQAEAWAAGVQAARDAWVSDFDGAQFSVGRAWYTHLEQGRAGDYFANVNASDATVERACPGLQAAVRTLASQAVGAAVVARQGWCGPGVHVFPARALVAERGGDIHFDTEGLTPAHVAERAPAYTVVLMLRPPVRGGGLRIWDVPYAGTDAYEDSDLERAHVTCDYEAGDLLLIDSYRLHQIQPFGGGVDRVSATCHLALVGGEWETWF